MQHVIVTYENGAHENIDLSFKIPQGGESLVIDLRGGKRGFKW